MNQVKATTQKKNRKVTDFVQIKNQTESSADIYLYGDIVSSEWDKWTDSDTAPEDVRNFLAQINGVSNLNVYINSGGGSVFAGLNIYNMLKRHEAHVTVHVDGLAGSIASVIAMAADKLIMPSNSFLMIHKPMLGIFGNANDLQKAIDDLNAIESGLMNVYAEQLKDGVEISEIQAMLDAETWLNGNEAAKYFNVEVVGANKMAAHASEFFNQYESIPEELNVSEGLLIEPEQHEETAAVESENKKRLLNKLRLLELSL